MSDNTSRRSAVAEWLREISALLTVFPFIDQLVRDAPIQHFDWSVALGGVALGLFFLAIGIALIKGVRG